jgi:hypothetical protein
VEHGGWIYTITYSALPTTEGGEPARTGEGDELLALDLTHTRALVHASANPDRLDHVWALCHLSFMS